MFSPPREVVGKCPRCGGEVAQLQKGFFCQNEACRFAIWKNSKWWAAEKKQPTKMETVQKKAYIEYLTELMKLTDSTLSRLWVMTDDEFAESDGTLILVGEDKASVSRIFTKTLLSISC